MLNLPKFQSLRQNKDLRQWSASSLQSALMHKQVKSYNVIRL